LTGSPRAFATRSNITCTRFFIGALGAALEDFALEDPAEGSRFKGAAPEPHALKTAATAAKPKKRRPAPGDLRETTSIGVAHLARSTDRIAEPASPAPFIRSTALALGW
jgi:hypothetical protein